MIFLKTLPIYYLNVGGTGWGETPSCLSCYSTSFYENEDFNKAAFSYKNQDSLLYPGISILARKRIADNRLLYNPRKRLKHYTED